MNHQQAMMQMQKTPQAGNPHFVHQQLNNPFVSQQMFHPDSTQVQQNMCTPGQPYPQYQPQCYQKATLQNPMQSQENSHAQLQAQQQFKQQIHERIHCMERCLAELSTLFQYTMEQPSGQMGPIFSEHVPMLNIDAQTTKKPPTKKRKRLTLPDGTKVKYPRNEYLWWYMEYTKKNKDSGKGSLDGKNVKEIWSNLSDEEKEHYKKLAEEDTKRYKEEVNKAKAVEPNASHVTTH